MLNSFWRTFGENLQKKNTEAITTPAHLFHLVSDRMYNIHAIRIFSNEVLEVNYSHLSEGQPNNGHVNIFVAAFMTCWAHLKLYSYLQQLQQQVMYFDRASFIFSCKPKETDIPLGDFLGDMMDELEGHDQILDFSSAGPKNYGYKTKQGKVCGKVQGFTFNVRGQQQLNYNIIRRNLLDELIDPLDKRRNIDVVNPHFFMRDPATKHLQVGPRTKWYGVVFDKWFMDTDTLESYPYGYHLRPPSSDEVQLDDQDMTNMEALLDL